MAYKQKLVNRKFTYINKFDHEGPGVVRAINSLTIGVFEKLDITSPMDVKKRVSHTQRILKGAALKKYREVLVPYRQSAKELAGYEWNFGKLVGLSAEAFWTQDKMDTMGYDGNAYLTLDICVDFERELWPELGKCMWRKHWSVYQ